MAEMFADAVIIEAGAAEPQGVPAVAEDVTPAAVDEPITDAAVTTEPETPGEAEEPSEPEAPTEPARPSRRQDRIKQLVDQRNLAQQRAADAEARAQAAEAALQGAETPDLAQQIAAGVQRALAAERAADAAAVQQQVLAEQRAQMQAQHPDFEAVLSQSPLEASPAVSIAVQQIAEALPVLYHLAKHPDELAVLNALPPLEAAAEVRRLGQKLATGAPASSTPAQTVSRAPAPLAPTRGQAGGATPNLERMSLAEYTAYMNKLTQEQRRRSWG